VDLVARASERPLELRARPRVLRERLVRRDGDEARGRLRPIDARNGGRRLRDDVIRRVGEDVDGRVEADGAPGARGGLREPRDGTLAARAELDDARALSGADDRPPGREVDLVE